MGSPFSVSHGGCSEGSAGFPSPAPLDYSCPGQESTTCSHIPSFICCQLWVPGWRWPARGRGGGTKARLWTLLWGARCLLLVLLANHVSGESRDVGRAVGGGTTVGLPWGTFSQPLAQAHLPSDSALFLSVALSFHFAATPMFLPLVSPPLYTWHQN